MAAHAAIPVRKPFGTHGLATPIVIGVLYGLYAATVARHGGPTTLGQLWLGLVSAVVLAGGIYVLRRFGRALPRELRALAWGSLTGIAVGFLFSLSGASVLSSSGLGLAFAGVNVAAAYYLFYTHEDAAGRPAPY
ncbi:hypothetical protein DEJ45_18760 [Streptomyces venezuelae]|uniref:hypothetical protein n=1 Tax=Streptomyces venezuelae TaxID=54571 RepID=UPI00123DD388|nr:hypothetical protein [Streptomyces venezuelae]QES14237.1 hypothetical protein DEJ45_18760 [Streptomyces venezuelae]